MSLPGQSKAPFATRKRDFHNPDQKLEFPRGPVNHKLYHNEYWEINKEKYNERYTMHDCCNIQTNGNITSSRCAFKRVDIMIPDPGNFQGFH